MEFNSLVNKVPFMYCIYIFMYVNEDCRGIKVVGQPCQCGASSESNEALYL